MRPRPTIRLRLTAMYALVVFLAGGLLLAVSYALLDGHLHNTLSDATADGVLAQLRGQYLLALVAVTALAVLLGWMIAGRALAPLRTIATAARAVSGESLTSRVALRGPDDELHELADTFDEMLERLDSAFASQKRFVADASHELRTPLTVLRTEVEVALANPDASAAELRATAEVVREEVQRFEALLESLLALARSEARALAREEPVDLADLTRQVVSRLQAGAATRDVLLTVEAEPAIVNGDRGLLEQLVFNLVDNAIAHNCRGGFAEVLVEAARRQGCAERCQLGTPHSRRERSAAHRAVPPPRAPARPARRRRGTVDCPGCGGGPRWPARTLGSRGRRPRRGRGTTRG